MNKQTHTRTHAHSTCPTPPHHWITSWTDWSQLILPVGKEIVTVTTIHS